MWRVCVALSFPAERLWQKMPILFPPIKFMPCSHQPNCLVLANEWVCKSLAYSCSSWKVFKVIYFNWINEVRFFSGHDCVGRHRWVEYAQKGRYNASQVPAEWHGWLHFVTDHTGDEVSHCPLFLQCHLKHIVHIMIKCLWCSYYCWNQRDMGLNTKRTFPERVKSLSIIPKGTPLILGRETGQGTNPGSQLSPKFPFLHLKRSWKSIQNASYVSLISFYELLNWLLVSFCFIC